MTVPESGTDAHRWWERGAHDEYDAHREGMSPEQREAHDLLVNMFKANPNRPPDEALRAALHILTGADERRQHTLRLDVWTDERDPGEVTGRVERALTEAGLSVTVEHKGRGILPDRKDAR